jgi:hypothetical protein
MGPDNPVQAIIARGDHDRSTKAWLDAAAELWEKQQRVIGFYSRQAETAALYQELYTTNGFAKE